MSLISSTGETPGNYRRRKEKETSAKSRAQSKKPKTRNNFDDQSNVDKLYEWLYNTGKYRKTQYDLYND